MIYPFVVLFYFFIVQYFSNNFKLVKDTYSYIFLVLVVFFSFVVIELLRIYCQSIFGDIPNYKVIFEEIDSVSTVVRNGYGIEYYFSSVEIGFNLFISFFKIFSNSFNLFLFFVSIIKLSIFYLFCRKYNISFVNVLPIYIAMIFVTFEIGMLRQGLGFSCLLIALMNIEKKLIYLLFIAIGSTFHISTLFGILLIWTDKFINRKIYYLIFFLSLCLYVLKIDLVSSIAPYFEILEIGNSGRVSYYLDVERNNNYLGIGFWERCILLVSMNLIYIDLWKKNRINKYNNMIFNLGIALILLQFIFFASPTITSRLRYFIVIFPAIFISQYIYIESTKISRKGSRKLANQIYQLLFLSYLVMYLLPLVTYLR